MGMHLLAFRHVSRPVQAGRGQRQQAKKLMSKAASLLPPRSSRQSRGGSAMTKAMRLIRTVLGIGVVFIIMLGLPIFAGAADYVVRPDDRLRIKIFQFPELSA